MEVKIRDEEDIIKRLRNYKQHLIKIRNDKAKQIIKQAILELSWILGMDSNRTMNIR